MLKCEDWPVSDISRLESVNSKISPKLSTIEEYAKAVWYEIEINFVPHENWKGTNLWSGLKTHI